MQSASEESSHNLTGGFFTTENHIIISITGQGYYFHPVIFNIMICLHRFVQAYSSIVYLYTHRSQNPSKALSGEKSPRQILSEKTLFSIHLRSLKLKQLTYVSIGLIYMKFSCIFWYYN